MNINSGKIPNISNKGSKKLILLKKTSEFKNFE